MLIFGYKKKKKLLKLSSLIIEIWEMLVLTCLQNVRQNHHLFQFDTSWGIVNTSKRSYVLHMYMMALRSSLWLSNSSIKTFLPQPEANIGELGSMVNVYTTRTHGKLQVLTRKSNYSGGMLIIITCPD